MPPSKTSPTISTHRDEKIPDFTNFEIDAVQSTVNERFGHEIEIQLGDAEYVDIADCIITLLQTQADHHSQRSGEFPPDTDSK